MKAFLVLVVILSTSLVLGLENGIGLTPPMGWNSWNHFGCNISEALIKKTAEALVSTGLAAKGYKYINLDDCWQVSRDEKGRIVADPVAFPSGIKSLADYIHGLGLKFGLYSDAGYKTCAGRPGSLGYEEIDAQVYAEWGVDYLKYDNCNTDGSSPKVRYPPMRDALNKTGRQIFFSMCEWGVEDPATWAPGVGNSWRTTGDIIDNWYSFVHILDSQVGLEKYSGPGGWNDPDMLEVGNGGMKMTEYESHFSLWALLKAPLLIGNDLTNMKPEVLELLGNSDIIAVNQDKLGKQGRRIKRSFLGKEVWAGELEGGSVAVILFNRGWFSMTIDFNFADVGFSHDTAEIYDLFTHSSVGVVKSSFSSSVKSGGVRFIKLSPTTLDAKASNIRKN